MPKVDHADRREAASRRARHLDNLGRSSLWRKAVLAAEWLIYQSEQGNLSAVRLAIARLGQLAPLVVLEMSHQMAPSTKLDLARNLIFGLEVDEPPQLQINTIDELALLEMDRVTP